MDKSRKARFFLVIVLSYVALSAAAGDESPTAEFTVATYNVHGIFVPDLKACPFGTRKYRFSRIADVTNRYDVILLQEFFRTKSRGDHFRHFLLEPSNHPYQEYQRDVNFTTYDSGLGALVGPRLSEQSSSLSVTEYHGIPGQYPRCSGRILRGNDCFSTKGYGRLVIDVLGQPVIVYLTHLDSADSPEDQRVRVGQMRELKEAMTGDTAAGQAVVLVGDFNTIAGTGEVDSQELQTLHESLELTPVKPGDSPNPAETCGAWKLCQNEVIDHFFFRSGGRLELQIVEAYWLKPRGGRFCSSLSDHPMLVAKLRARLKATL